MGRGVWVWVFTTAWLVVTVAGFWRWERYDRIEGRVGEITAVPGEPTGSCRLRVFLHPHCPCSRATLHELTAITRATPALSIHVLFVRPNGTPDDWERGELWDAANQIPGVEVASDPGGAAARRFGAVTSGHAVLTDPTGRVAFRGGLTAARGRTGGSIGRSAVTSWVSGNTGESAAPVFGCRLSASDE